MAEPFQLVEHLGYRLRGALHRCIADDLRMKRLLIRVADAGEVGDLAGDRLAIKAFGVALDQRVERRPHEHLDEAGRLAPQLVAHLAIRRDRGRDGYAAAACDQPCHVADAPDVRVAVFFGEAETLGEMRADLVAVEQLGVAPAMSQLGLQRGRDGRFARAREPGEPHDETLAHASPPRPHRRLIAASNTPDSPSMATPMTKITTIMASSCSVSAKSLPNWSCSPIDTWCPTMPSICP